MDFQDTPEQAEWRNEVRTFIENERPPEYDPDKGMQGGEDGPPRNAAWYKRWTGNWPSGVGSRRPGRRSTAARTSA